MFWYCGDQAPALHLPRPHVDDWPPLAVDRQEARRGFRKERAELLDHVGSIEHHLGQQHDPLACLGDLRHVGEVTLDDDGAGHAARHLHVGRTVVMWMVPVGAARVVLGQRDLDVVGLARQHRAHDVVGDAARAAVRAVEMEIRVVVLMRKRRVGRRQVAVGRQVVGEPDLHGFARLQTQGGRQATLVGAQIETHAADVAIGKGAAQAGAEHAVRRAADLRLDKRLVHRRYDRHARDAEFRACEHARAATCARAKRGANVAAPSTMPPFSTPRRENQPHASGQSRHTPADLPLPPAPQPRSLVAPRGLLPRPRSGLALSQCERTVATRDVRAVR